METLGKKIRTLRRKQKLTQQELAQGLVTASMISQIESDRATPSAALLEQLATRLGADLSLFEGDLTDKSDELQNYRAARHHIDAGRYREAIALLETLSLPLSPQFKPEVVYNEMANCYIQLGDYLHAARMYEQLIQVGFERNDTATVVHAYYHAGLMLKRMHRNEVARMYWQRALDTLQQHTSFYMPISLKISANLARLHLQEGNYSEAKRAYLHTLSIWEQNGGSLDLAKTYQGLACACMYLGDFDAALVYNQKAVDAHIVAENPKGTIRCRINEGVILRHAKRFEEAKRGLVELKQSISERDDALWTALLHELAAVLMELGDSDGVMAESDAALQRNKIPDAVEAELRLFRASVQCEYGQVDLALRELERGHRLIPTENTRLQVAYNSIQRQCWLRTGRDEDVIRSCVDEAARTISSSSQRLTRHIPA